MKEGGNVVGHFGSPLVQNWVGRQELRIFLFPCPAMYQVFQMELNRIHLLAARTYAQALESSLTPISETLQEPLKMNAVVSRKKGDGHQVMVHVGPALD